MKKVPPHPLKTFYVIFVSLQGVCRHVAIVSFEKCFASTLFQRGDCEGEPQAPLRMWSMAQPRRGSGEGISLLCATWCKGRPWASFAARNQPKQVLRSVLVAHLRCLRWFPLANGKICRRQINLVNNNLSFQNAERPRISSAGVFMVKGDRRTIQTMAIAHAGALPTEIIFT